MGVLELISGAETDYEFTLLQLILLMELADAESVFTYPLPEDGEFTDEDYILAMHDLIGRGFVEVTEEADGESEPVPPYSERSSGDNDGDNIGDSIIREFNTGLYKETIAEGKTGGPAGPVFSLSKKAVDLFGNIFRAGHVLEAVSAWEGVLPSLIYRGSSSCAVTQWDLQNGYINVSSIEASGLGTWLEEAGFLPGHPFETEREGEKALRYDAQTLASLDRIRSSLVCTPDVPAPLWALQEDVRCVLRTAEKSKDDPGKLAVFFETDTESWILISDTGSGGNAPGTGNQEWEIVPDSHERRDRLWREIL